MEALKTNKALKAQIEDMKIEREEANNTIENIQGQLDAANAQLVEKDEAIATLTAQKEEAVEAQENTAAQLQEVSADLEKTQEDLVESEESTNAKAVELAASAGHQAKGRA